MRSVSATLAKNRFGALCAEAKAGPILVEKDGRPDSVILSIEDYRALVEPPPAELDARRRAFAQRHRKWLSAYRAQVESRGVFSDGLRSF